MTTPSSSRYLWPRLPEGFPLPTQEEDEEKENHEEEEETRDWAELPWDALLAVLGRLDSVDILMGPGQACRPWRRATREEPELWRRVDMRPLAKLAPGSDYREMARAAVRRSAGRCEAFWGEGAVDDDFLFFLADAGPTLKSLRLISCNNILTKSIDEAIAKFPLLEELELSLYSRTFASLYCLGEACPLLMRLRLSQDRYSKSRGVDDREAEAIAGMPGLRSLQLFASSLSNAGLVAILDGCPRLESLDIRHCFNIEMNDEMHAKVARIRTVRLPYDSMDDYDLRYDSPCMDSASVYTPEYSFRGDIFWDTCY